MNTFRRLRLPLEGIQSRKSELALEKPSTTPDSHRLVTKSDKVEPLTKISRHQMKDILKELVLDFRELDQARKSLELSSDFSCALLFETVLGMSEKSSPPRSSKAEEGRFLSREQIQKLLLELNFDDDIPTCAQLLLERHDRDHDSKLSESEFRSIFSRFGANH